MKLDDSSLEWRFLQLVEALDGKPGRRDKGRYPFLQAKQEGGKHGGCVYCKSKEHKSVDCDKIKEVADKRRYLSHNKLCFNCTGTSQRAAECRGTSTCHRCNEKHNSSICDMLLNQLTSGTTSGGQKVYPVVVLCVGGIRCSALLDKGAKRSYASAALISKLNRKPEEYKRIKMITTCTSQKIEMYNVQVSQIKGVFSFPLP